MTAEQLEELHNLETHRRAWRSAIVEMKRLADDGSDAGDMHYWGQELKAFDRTFALAPSLARRVLAAEKLAEALEDDAKEWKQSASVITALTAYREASR